MAATQATQKKKSKASAKENTKKAQFSVDDIPSIRREVLWRKNKDGTIAVMKIDDDQYFYQIDGLAAKIWLQIDNKKSIAKIKDIMVKKLKPPPGKFKKDLLVFFQELQKEQLVLFT